LVGVQILSSERVSKIAVKTPPPSMGRERVGVRKNHSVPPPLHPVR